MEPRQYTSRAFAEHCRALGVTQSMGSVGTSADNALAESFNATLKRETLRGGHAFVVTAYHDLYQVERSFRMTKTDLSARPVFHRLRDSIEAHLTIVFAALAVSREAQARTGLSINKIVKTLRPLRTATITLGRQQITAEPRIPAAARQILDDLAGGGH